MEPVDLAKKIAKLVHDVKAEEIKILDLRKFSSISEFFVICSGSSTRQVQAIADKVYQTLKSEEILPFSKEGLEVSQWVILDYASVSLHVFIPEAREHYDLEGFWVKAPRLRMVLNPKKKTELAVTAKVKKPTKKKK